MENQLIPLGSGGWIPSRHFETACYAFRHGKNLYLIDAGSGIARLLDPADESLVELKEGIARVFILLSHYHIDHSHGLFYLRGLFPEIPTYLYAPGRGVYPHDAFGMIETLFAKPLSPRSIMDIHGLMEVNDLVPGKTWIGDLQVTTRLQKNHSDPSLGIRIADAFCYVSDTVPEKETVGFAEGCPVLLHEVWFSSKDAYRGLDDDLKKHTFEGHCGNFGAAIIARKAKVEELRFIHHNPLLPITKVQRLAAEVSDLVPNTMLARDLSPIGIKLPG
jgi:ribonuclease BN (tRNA processing enzyme)